MVPWALGSDTGGSIREPAAFCGVVGLKPTYGLVSRYGLVAFASSLDQIGPITKDVRDSAMLLNIITGHDEKDSTSYDRPKEDYVVALKNDVKGLRIGVPKEFFGEGIQENVAEQKEYFNWNLNRINKPWREKNPSFVPYEITPADYEIKIIKPGDPEFFNSLRYALIKNRGLTEIDKESALKIFKTWFHSVYYFFVSPPPNKTDTYYSTVYPHNAVSWEEMRITVELHD